jgi:hypothetical protein
MAFQFGQEVRSLRLVLTDLSTRIDGLLLSAPRDDLESYKIVVFAANQMHWKPGSRHVGIARPDREGRFRFHGLPPNVYYLAASRDVDESDISDPRVLDTLTAGALVIRLAAGQQLTETLRVPTAPGGTAAAIRTAAAARTGHDTRSR